MEKLSYRPAKPHPELHEITRAHISIAVEVEHIGIAAEIHAEKDEVAGTHITVAVGVAV